MIFVVCDDNPANIENLPGRHAAGPTMSRRWVGVSQTSRQTDIILTERKAIQTYLYRVYWVDIESMLLQWCTERKNTKKKSHCLLSALDQLAHYQKHVYFLLSAPISEKKFRIYKNKLVQLCFSSLYQLFQKKFRSFLSLLLSFPEFDLINFSRCNICH